VSRGQFGRRREEVDVSLIPSRLEIPQEQQRDLQQWLAGVQGEIHEFVTETQSMVVSPVVSIPDLERELDRLDALATRLVSNLPPLPALRERWLAIIDGIRQDLVQARAGNSDSNLGETTILVERARARLQHLGTLVETETSLLQNNGFTGVRIAGMESNNITPLLDAVESVFNFDLGTGNRRRAHVVFNILRHLNDNYDVYEGSASGRRARDRALAVVSGRAEDARNGVEYTETIAQEDHRMLTELRSGLPELERELRIERMIVVRDYSDNLLIIISGEQMMQRATDQLEALWRESESVLNALENNRDVEDQRLIALQRRYYALTQEVERTRAQEDSLLVGSAEELATDRGRAVAQEGTVRWYGQRAQEFLERGDEQGRRLAALSVLGGMLEQKVTGTRGAQNYLPSYQLLLDLVAGRTTINALEASTPDRFDALLREVNIGSMLAEADRTAERFSARNAATPEQRRRLTELVQTLRQMVASGAEGIETVATMLRVYADIIEESRAGAGARRRGDATRNVPGISEIEIAIDRATGQTIVVGPDSGVRQEYAQMPINALFTLGVEQYHISSRMIALAHTSEQWTGDAWQQNREVMQQANTRVLGLLEQGRTADARELVALVVIYSDSVTRFRTTSAREGLTTDEQVQVRRMRDANSEMLRVLQTFVSPEAEGSGSGTRGRRPASRIPQPGTGNREQVTGRDRAEREFVTQFTQSQQAYFELEILRLEALATRLGRPTIVDGHEDPITTAFRVARTRVEGGYFETAGLLLTLVANYYGVDDTGQPRPGTRDREPPTSRHEGWRFALHSGRRAGSNGRVARNQMLEAITLEANASSEPYDRAHRVAAQRFDNGTFVLARSSRLLQEAQDFRRRYFLGEIPVEPGMPAGQLPVGERNVDGNFPSSIAIRDVRHYDLGHRQRGVPSLEQLANSVMTAARSGDIGEYDHAVQAYMDRFRLVANMSLRNRPLDLLRTGFAQSAEGLRGIEQMYAQAVAVRASPEQPAVVVPHDEDERTPHSPARTPTLVAQRRRGPETVPVDLSRLPSAGERELAARARREAASPTPTARPVLQRQLQFASPGLYQRLVRLQRERTALHRRFERFERMITAGQQPPAEEYNQFTRDYSIFLGRVDQERRVALAYHTLSNQLEVTEQYILTINSQPGTLNLQTTRALEQLNECRDALTQARAGLIRGDSFNTVMTGYRTAMVHSANAMRVYRASPAELAREGRPPRDAIAPTREGRDAGHLRLTVPAEYAMYVDVQTGRLDSIFFGVGNGAERTVLTQATQAASLLERSVFDINPGNASGPALSLYRARQQRVAELTSSIFARMLMPGAREPMVVGQAEEDERTSAPAGAAALVRGRGPRLARSLPANSVTQLEQAEALLGEMHSNAERERWVTSTVIMTTAILLSFYPPTMFIGATMFASQLIAQQIIPQYRINGHASPQSWALLGLIIGLSLLGPMSNGLRGASRLLQARGALRAAGATEVAADMVPYVGHIAGAGFAVSMVPEAYNEFRQGNIAEGLSLTALALVPLGVSASLHVRGVATARARQARAVEAHVMGELARLAAGPDNVPVISEVTVEPSMGPRGPAPAEGGVVIPMRPRAAPARATEVPISERVSTFADMLREYSGLGTVQQRNEFLSRLPREIPRDVFLDLSRSTEVITGMRDGATPEQAQRSLDRIRARLEPGPRGPGGGGSRLGGPRVRASSQDLLALGNLETLVGDLTTTAPTESQMQRASASDLQRYGAEAQRRADAQQRLDALRAENPEAAELIDRLAANQLLAQAMRAGRHSDAVDRLMDDARTRLRELIPPEAGAGQVAVGQDWGPVDAVGGGIRPGPESRVLGQEGARVLPFRGVRPIRAGPEGGGRPPVAPGHVDTAGGNAESSVAGNPPRSGGRFGQLTRGAYAAVSRRAGRAWDRMFSRNQSAGRTDAAALNNRMEGQLNDLLEFFHDSATATQMAADFRAQGNEAAARLIESAPSSMRDILRAMLIMEFSPSTPASTITSLTELRLHLYARLATSPNAGAFESFRTMLAELVTEPQISRLISSSQRGGDGLRFVDSMESDIMAASDSTGPNASPANRPVVMRRFAAHSLSEHMPSLTLALAHSAGGQRVAVARRVVGLGEQLQQGQENAASLLEVGRTLQDVVDNGFRSGDHRASVEQAIDSAGDLVPQDARHALNTARENHTRAQRNLGAARDAYSQAERNYRRAKTTAIRLLQRNGHADPDSFSDAQLLDALNGIDSDAARNARTQLERTGTACEELLTASETASNELDTYSSDLSDALIEAARVLSPVLRPVYDRQVQVNTDTASQLRQANARFERIANGQSIESVLAEGANLNSPDFVPWIEDVLGIRLSPVERAGVMLDLRQNNLATPTDMNAERMRLSDNVMQTADDLLAGIESRLESNLENQGMLRILRALRDEVNTGVNDAITATGEPVSVSLDTVLLRALNSSSVRDILVEQYGHSGDAIVDALTPALERAVTGEGLTVETGLASIERLLRIADVAHAIDPNAGGLQGAIRQGLIDQLGRTQSPQSATGEAAPRPQAVSQTPLLDVLRGDAVADAVVELYGGSESPTGQVAREIFIQCISNSRTVAQAQRQFSFRLGALERIFAMDRTGANGEVRRILLEALNENNLFNPNGTIRNEIIARVRADVSSRTTNPRALDAFFDQYSDISEVPSTDNLVVDGLIETVRQTNSNFAGAGRTSRVTGLVTEFLTGMNTPQVRQMFDAGTGPLRQAANAVGAGHVETARGRQAARTRRIRIIRAAQTAWRRGVVPLGRDVIYARRWGLPSTSEVWRGRQPGRAGAEDAIIGIRPPGILVRSAAHLALLAGLGYGIYSLYDWASGGANDTDEGARLALDRHGARIGDDNSRFILGQGRQYFNTAFLGGFPVEEQRRPIRPDDMRAALEDPRYLVDPRRLDTALTQLRILSENTDDLNLALSHYRETGETSLLIINIRVIRLNRILESCGLTLEDLENYLTANNLTNLDFERDGIALLRPHWLEQGMMQTYGYMLAETMCIDGGIITTEESDSGNLAPEHLELVRFLESNPDALFYLWNQVRLGYIPITNLGEAIRLVQTSWRTLDRAEREEAFYQSGDDRRSVMAIPDSAFDETLPRLRLAQPMPLNSFFDRLDRLASLEEPETAGSDQNSLRSQFNTLLERYAENTNAMAALNAFRIPETEMLVGNPGELAEGIIRIAELDVLLHSDNPSHVARARGALRAMHGLSADGQHADPLRWARYRGFIAPELLVSLPVETPEQRAELQRLLVFAQQYSTDDTGIIPWIRSRSGERTRGAGSITDLLAILREFAEPGFIASLQIRVPASTASEQEIVIYNETVARMLFERRDAPTGRGGQVTPGERTDRARSVQVRGVLVNNEEYFSDRQWFEGPTGRTEPRGSTSTARRVAARTVDAGNWVAERFTGAEPTQGTGPQSTVDATLPVATPTRLRQEYDQHDMRRGRRGTPGTPEGAEAQVQEEGAQPAAGAEAQTQSPELSAEARTYFEGNEAARDATEAIVTALVGRRARANGEPVGTEANTNPITTEAGTDANAMSTGEYGNRIRQAAYTYIQEHNEFPTDIDEIDTFSIAMSSNLSGQFPAVGRSRPSRR